MHNEIYTTEYDVEQKFIEIIQKRIDDLYKSITESSAFKKLNEAQQKVNDLMNEVNSVITYNITGEEPCTHDCSSCGGSCHHH